MLAVAGGEGEGAAAGIELSAPGEYPIVQEKQTITVIGTYDQRLASGTLEDAKFTEYFEELTNVHVDWVETIEWEEAVEKYNLILAAGDLPDVLIPHSRITVQQAFDQGRRRGLHRPQGPDRRAHARLERAARGGAGGAPAHHHAGRGELLLPDRFRRLLPLPVLDQDVGLPALGRPARTEVAAGDARGEFADMLRAFRDRDPNGNGKQDEIPFLSATSGWNVDPISFLMNAWIYTVHPYDLNYGAFLERSPADVRFVANTPGVARRAEVPAHAARRGAAGRGVVRVDREGSQADHREPRPFPW